MNRPAISLPAIDLVLIRCNVKALSESNRRSLQKAAKSVSYMKPDAMHTKFRMERMNCNRMARV